MTLLITIFAGVIATVCWYKDTENKYKISTLLYLYWGASMMWTVDSICEYFSDTTTIFNPSGAELINDGFLGLSAVAFGLVIWLIRFILSDPSGRIKKLVSRK